MRCYFYLHLYEINDPLLKKYILIQYSTVAVNMVPSEPLLTSLSLMFPVITICLTIASTWLLWLPRHAPPNPNLKLVVVKVREKSITSEQQRLCYLLSVRPGRMRQPDNRGEIWMLNRMMSLCICILATENKHQTHFTAVEIHRKQH